MRPISAAVILADKSDVHRSRVRKSGQIEFDIHDRVNYAAEQSFLRVDSEARTVTLELTIDTEISQVMEYFEIFLGTDADVPSRRRDSSTAGSGSRSTGLSSHEGNPLAVGLHRASSLFLVVASLVGFATGALKPMLGLDLEGGVSVILQAPDGHAGPGDATGTREHPQPRRRVRRGGAAHLRLRARTIEVQLPGLAKGTIQQRPKTQVCLIGGGGENFGCDADKTAAQSTLDDMTVSKQAQFCLSSDTLKVDTVCFGSNKDAKSAVSGLTVSQQPAGASGATGATGRRATGQWCVTAGHGRRQLRVLRHPGQGQRGQGRRHDRRQVPVLPAGRRFDQPALRLRHHAMPRRPRSMPSP